ncbi:nitrophenyl compound nitroreductase subunit ArsF family protein [Marinilabilia rubra]|uniref:Thioredoxin domain-containing protein n=1 Tax=Marinilabilia rubra TaxID=2162893 RepID=A0A2U2B6B6_9BACT|nr:nitrophenyl compound nitroreductase subunit ArsF family protein [Marinilabilia rubra]PWD98620.1 hypothetical protein DDZ16_14255 [Marinilabilia rubra]
MKKQFSIITSVLLLTLIAITSSSCKSTPQKQGNSKEESSEMITKASNLSEVEVYYFHATRRCATCEAVEEVTKEALAEEFGKDISFNSINREEQTDHPLIKKHNISGQTLLIVKGNQTENLTNFAFMNARTNPEKLKTKIKETIESL